MDGSIIIPDSLSCTKCSIEKPLSEFEKRKSGRYGIRSQCKQCRRVQGKTWRSTLESKWYRATVLGEKTARYYYAKGQAHRTGHAFNITKDQYAMLISTNCTYCDLSLSPSGIGLDRIDNSIDYSIDNVNPSCRECNVARNDNFTVDEMKSIIGPAIRQAKLARQIKDQS